MKKIAKSLFCLIMSFMLVLACTACNDENSNTIENATVEEETSLSLYDAEKVAEDYFADKETLLEITSPSTTVQSLIDADTDKEYTEIIEDLITYLLDLVKINAIESTMVDDTTAVVTVEVSYPDIDNVDESNYSSDDYVIKKLEEIGYTQDYLTNLSDEKEAYGIMVELYIAMVKDIATDADVVSVQETVNVVYENDQWVVVE